MRVLVTGSRMPFALAIIRKLAEEGHEVLASDAWEVAPGSHSRYVSEHFVTASPRDETEKFVDGRRAHRHRERGRRDRPGVRGGLLPLDPVGAPGAGRDPCSSRRSPRSCRCTTRRASSDSPPGSGLPMAKTVIAHSRRGAAPAALERFPQYFARAAFSRGRGVAADQRGAARRQDPARGLPPDRDQPLARPGVRRGRHVLHLQHRPRRAGSPPTAPTRSRASGSTRPGSSSARSTGAPTLEIVAEIVGRTSYTGQVSFDFIDSPDGPYLVECNPRATDGALLMSSPQLARGLLEPDADCQTVPAGEEIQLDLAVFGGIFADGLREVPSTFHDLLHIRGSDRGWHDALPEPLLVPRAGSLGAPQAPEHAELFVAMAGDLSWDGDPIAGMSEADVRRCSSPHPADDERTPGRSRRRRRRCRAGRSRGPGTKLWWISSVTA